MASIGSNSSGRASEVAASRVDIVVALSSHNDARTIGAVARAVRDGLSRSFASREVQLVLADAGSTDGTREAAREVVGASALLELEYDRRPHLNELPYHGQPGRAAAMRAVLETAQRLSATACVVVDAALHTVGPEWVERLVGPIVTGQADYVSPHYLRGVNEGAITKSIVYPMVRALYGRRLRQPAAGEFGCSGPLVAHYLEQDFWNLEQASVGIDLWLAVAAACGEFRICEAALGPRRVTSRGPALDLSTTLAQLVAALFVDLERRVDVWQRVRGSAALPVLGVPVASGREAAPLDVDHLLDSFRLGYRELREVWTWVLPPRTIVELRRLTESPPDRFRFDDRLWATIIYDFALGFSLHVLPRAHLLRSLTPLYTGWLASYILQMKAATPDQAEAWIEQLCLAFESEKRYLISRWRWPERLR
jgi:glucosylglycerate synthase